MSQQQPRRVEDSRTEQVHVLMPTHMNGANRLFGGQLAKWIDEVAGIVAARHCGKNITTLAIDNLRFREPAFLGQIIVMIGKMTYVGHTAMEVRVDSFVEDLSGERRLINTAFVIQVALGKDARPCEVPGLILENEFQKSEFEAGGRRQALRKQMGGKLYG